MKFNVFYNTMDYLKEFNIPFTIVRDSKQHNIKFYTDIQTQTDCTIRYREKILFELENVYIYRSFVFSPFFIVDNNILLDQDNVLMNKVHSKERQRLDEILKFLKDNPPTKDIQFDTMYWLGMVHNYYHLLFDVVPKILYKQEHPDLNQIPILIDYPAIKQLNPFQCFLEYNITRNINLLNCRNWNYIKRLVVSSFSTYTDDEELNFIRNGINHLYKDISGKEKIYIYRTGNRREIKNQDELASILIDFDYEIIKPEEMSFRDQILCFSSAKKIISSHGAGLTNLSWCLSNNKVLEIFPKSNNESFITMDFILISNYLKNDHFCLGQPRIDKCLNLNDSVMMVDIKKVIEWEKNT